MVVIGHTDDEYKKYIESLPCFLCGHKAEGNRKIYDEYSDDFKLLPCKNTAHHVDTTMTRTKNDHRIIPLCSHYVISGRGTRNCHELMHSKAEYKTQEYREHLNQVADKYYEEYLKSKGETNV